MYIGLIDYDVITQATHAPNLEIMKLSAYHKHNNDIVKLITDCNEYEQFSKIYFRKNESKVSSPSKFLSIIKDKVEYGGDAYTNGIYVPMAPEIENCVPDVSIYSNLKSDFRVYVAERFTNMENRNYIRLETTDNISKMIVNPTRRTYVYDNNPLLFPEKWEELCVSAKKINVFAGLRYEKLEDFLPLYQQEIITADTPIYLNTVPKFEQLKEIPGSQFFIKILKDYQIGTALKEVTAIEQNIDKITMIREYNKYIKFENNCQSKEGYSLISILNTFTARGSRDIPNVKKICGSQIANKFEYLRRISSNGK